MTQEEAKELWPIVKAYSEGRTIEYLTTGDEWVELKDPGFNYNANMYRIKPDPKYRPFKNANECFEEMKKHEPFGWIINTYGNYFSIIHIAKEGCTLCNDVYKIYSEALEIGLRFIDGTPFGIKEDYEEENNQ